MKRLRSVTIAAALVVAGLAMAPNSAAADTTTVVGMATTATGAGHWLVDDAGHITTDGDATSFGSLAGQRLNQPIVGIAATPSGSGYWLVARDGGIFSFGDARFHGSTGAIRLNQPIVGLSSTTSGNGYWLVARDGGIFSFGDAAFLGSTGDIRLNRPIVGMAATTSGNGYWLVARDGGIFSFGDARFHGSTGTIRLNEPIVGMAAAPSGEGYWLAAADGGIFSFGDAPFAGTGPSDTTAVVGGGGYALASGEGQVRAFRLGNGRKPAPAPDATTTTTTAPSPTTTAPAPAPTTDGLLFAANYDTGSVLPSWQAEQEPATDRISVVSGHAGRPGAAMRVELRPGDVTNTGGYLANRAEVYGRHASPRTTPADQWPDPVGSTRWYSFDLFVPADFTFDVLGTQWFTLTQWKGLDSGSPPIALEIKRDHLDLGGVSGRQNLGLVKRGVWETITVGVHFQPNSSGWVEVYRDGQQALPRTYRATMNLRTLDGVQQVDPSYLKQGIYRTTAWVVTHVLYFGPMRIGTTRAAVS
jgi:hypothetical protein